jgi:hypothetical protein
MAGPWDTPPTAAEMARTDVWSTPPTAAEMGGSDEDFGTLANAAQEAPGAALAHFPQLGAPSDKARVSRSVRESASYKGTKTGVYNYLVDEYGKDNVEPVVESGGRGGELTRSLAIAKFGMEPQQTNHGPRIVNFKVRLKDGSVALLDPRGPDVGDINDLAADAVETGPAAVGSILGGLAGGPPGAAAGGAAGAALGSAAKQYIGANWVPGEENMSTADRVVSGGANVAGTVLGEVAAPYVSRALEPVVHPVRSFFGRRARNAVVEQGASALERSIAKDAAQPISEAAGDVVPKFSMVLDAAPPAPARLPGDPGDPSVAMLRASDTAAEGAALAKRTNVDLTPGQMTGNQEQISLERTVAQLPGGKNDMLAGDVNRALQFQSFTTNAIDKSAGESVGATQAVRNTGLARKAQMEHMNELRAKAATSGFGDAIGQSRGQAIVPTPNAIAEIDAMIGEYKGAFTGDSASKIVSALKAKRDELVGALDVTIPGKVEEAPLEIGMYGTKAKMPDGRSVPVGPGRNVKRPTITTPERTIPGSPADVRITVRQLQNDLREVGKNAAGSGKFIETGDHDLDRQVASRFFGALQRDLSAAAESSDPVLASSARGLKTARDTYREMSREIEAQDDLLFDQAIKLIDKGDDPGKLIHTLATGGDNGTFTPNQVAKTMGTLREISPVAARQLKGETMRALLSGTAPNANSFAAKSGVMISPRQFATMVQKNVQRIKALYHGDEEGFAAIMDAARVAARLGDDAGMAGAQTAPFMAFQGLFEAVSTIGPRAATAPLQTAKEIGSAVAHRASAADLAAVFNNPEASRIYLGLARPKRALGREQVAAGIARIKAVVERDRRLFSDMPDGEMQPAPQPQQAPPSNIATEGAYP